MARSCQNSQSNLLALEREHGAQHETCADMQVACLTTASGLNHRYDAMKQQQSHSLQETGCLTALSGQGKEQQFAIWPDNTEDEGTYRHKT